MDIKYLDIIKAPVITEKSAVEAENNQYVNKVREFASTEGAEVVVVCAQIESEIAELDTEEEKDAIRNENESNDGMLNAMKDALKDEVVAVRFTNKLKNHPVALSTEGEISIDMAKALKAFMIEVEKMRRFGFNDGEVQRATENILKHYEKAVEAASTRKNGDLVSPLLNNFYRNESYLQPELSLQLAQGLCAQFNAQVLNQIVAQLITDENLIVLYNGPSKEGSVIPTEQEIRDVLAEAKAAKEVADKAVELVAPD